MRAYFFGNMYLSSIQQGIQAAHTVVELYNKYTVDFTKGFDFNKTQQYLILDNWAQEHKTMVLLNAGYGEEIRSLIKFFSSTDNPLPWACFHEGVDALDGALTCAGIILPEEFYEGAKEIRGVVPGLIGTDLTPNFNKLQPGWEQDMAIRLNNYQLAK